jgi:zinc protease
VAPAVSARNRSSELAGDFTLQVRAYEGRDLDDVQAAIDAAFARFEVRGVPADELERVKASYETNFYRGISSVLGKAFQLAEYNIFAKDPGYVTEDLNRLLAVTAADAMRVYNAYLKGRPFVAASFVPRGSLGLALEGSTQAQVVVEPIVQGAEAELTGVHRGTARTPSAIDRSTEPPYGTSPTLSAPPGGVFAPWCRPR